MAHEQWTRLGAHATVVLPGPRFESRALEAVAGADVIVLPGGVPNRLMAGLSGSAVIGEIVTRWTTGAAITGSSAGAMNLFEKRLSLYPPDPFRLIPGLGLLTGYLAAPHFDRLRVRHWYRPFIGRLQGLGVLGIDESTGLVGRDGLMQVLGAGSVSIATDDGIHDYPAGSMIDLGLGFVRQGSGGLVSSPSRSTPRQLQPATAASSPHW